MKKWFLSLVTVAMLFVASTVYGASVKLSWDANTEADLAGYKIYYKVDVSGAPYTGVGATEGNAPVLVPLSALSSIQNPVFSLNNLSKNIYYFVVTAYDTEGLESDFSNEVSADFRQNGIPPAKPTGLQALWDKLLSWFKGWLGSLKVEKA